MWMVDPPPFRGINIGGAQRVSAAFQAVNRQPNWVARAAMLTFLVVVGIPILLLLLLAAMAASVVFVVLIGVSRVARLFRGSQEPPGGGRRNVRVINRD